MGNSGKKPYRREAEMYPEVVAWLRERLTSRFSRRKILVADTSQVYLSRFLSDNNYHSYFPDYLTYEIQVDVTAVVATLQAAQLVFLECKLSHVTLRDVSQLLGYSRVASPLTSLIVSPSGLSRSLDHLLNVYQRWDMLEYSRNRSIIIGTWDSSRRELDFRTVLPKAYRLFH